MKPFPTLLASQLPAAPPSAHNWLIEGLWGAEAVGIIGGEPKTFKSFLALDLAVAVASGAPCLRHFPTAQRGPVLLFAGEDEVLDVRARLKGIAAAAGVAFESLDVHVITVPVLRLDRHDDRQALTATVAGLQPRLLVLDPFVRLHCIDENVAGEVAPLLGFLRTLQRIHHTAIALVHHARKGAAHERGGQALRGSSELHAWGSSNLYMRRMGRQLQLSIEHRAAAGRDWFPVTFKEHPPSLEVVDQHPASAPVPQPSCQQRIEQVLAAAGEPLTQKAVRDMVRMRTSDVSQALATLVANGRVIKSAGAYQPGPSR
jgi:hypothetical protein